MDNDAIVDAIIGATKGATKKWAKQRKKEERHKVVGLKSHIQKGQCYACEATPDIPRPIGRCPKCKSFIYSVTPAGEGFCGKCEPEKQ